MVCGDEDGTVFDVEIHEERMMQVHEFKQMRCMVNNRGAENIDYEKVINGRKVDRKIKELVNKKEPSLKCTRVLHESLLIGVWK